MQKVIASHDKLYCTYSWSGWCLLVVWYHVVSIWDTIMMLMMRSSLQSQNHRRKLIHVRENQNMKLNDLIKRWCRQCEFCLSKNSIHLNYCHLQFIKIDNSLLELDVQYWCTISTWCGCYGGTPWYISLLMAPLNVTIIQLDQYIL